MEGILFAIRSWNPWWTASFTTEKSIHRGILGAIIKSLELPHIKDIIGVRRSGKTTLLKQVIAYLISQGTKPEHILFLSLDDPAFQPFTLDNVLENALFLHPDIAYLFLDEVQEKGGWELWVKKQYDLKKFRQIFVSGSNAKILAGDVARSLTGRHLPFYVTPFEFKEYLEAFNWANFDENYLETHLAGLLHHFENFLARGGFPETIFLDPSDARKLLVNLYNDLIYRDVGSRSNVDFSKMHALAVFLCSNFTREYSYNKIAKVLKIHPETIETYLKLLEDAFAFKNLSIFSYKLATQFRQTKKMFIVDNGLRNAVAFHPTLDKGKMMENLVFNELIRLVQDHERMAGLNVYYWKDEKHEVDFVIAENAKVFTLIQACWDISDSLTYEREIKALAKAARLFPGSSCLVITRDTSKYLHVEDVPITMKPCALWLLDPARNTPGLV
jgi:predicted AAA+ superfamily ATPase